VQETFEGLTGGRVVEGYGLTEASPVTHCCPINGECRAGTIGVPFPDTDAKVVDQATGRRELAPGRIGELVVRGPQVMRGYWNNPAESRRALRHGWLFTGDLATRDRDGFFRIVERKKDMIKTRGENVYPRNVEEVLLRHPGVADVVVVGLPDEAAGERIKAYLVPQGERPSDADLVAWCAKSLAKFEIPQEFECRESLPKNIIGKTLRRILREEERRRKGERS
jgi:long-chain acyl-CoA synthetase